MKLVKMIVFFAVLGLVSCKKDYTCQCTNSITSYDAGEVKMTKRQAKKYCNELSAGETTCKVKE